MFVGFLRLRLGPHDVITCHTLFLLYLFNLRARLFSQDGKRLNIHLKVMNKRVFIINNLLKFFISLDLILKHFNHAFNIKVFNQLISMCECL